MVSPSKRALDQFKKRESLFKQGQVLAGQRKALNKKLRDKTEAWGEGSTEVAEVNLEIAHLDNEIVSMEDQAEKLANEEGENAEGVEQRTENQQAGFLLGRPGLILLLVMLAGAIWFGETVTAIFISLILAAAGFSRLWSRLSLEHVDCQRIISEARVFPGEQISLKIRLVNRKLLPLPWVQLEDEIPSALTGNIPFAVELYPGTSSLTIATSLLWYTGITWNYKLTCGKRGYYTLGPMTVTSGDILGLYPRSERRDLLDHLIVYPKLYPVREFDLISRYPVGETRSERNIFVDPTRTVGIRDYTSQDSLRFIHWKASARHQKLEVKVFEPSTTLKVSLFLAVDSFMEDGKMDEESLELGISTAASLAQFIINSRNQAGLHVNSHFIDYGDNITVMPGSDTTKLMELLEALAKVTNFPSGPFVGFLEKERKGLPWGTTVVVILSRPDKAMPPVLMSLKERGYKVAAIIVGMPDAALPDIPCFHVDRPEDLKSVVFARVSL
jgi:uncharacterized protein (DUF58 family)